MSTKEPMAFPTDGRNESHYVGSQQGMTLRDYFAAKALQGALAYANVGIEVKRTSDYAKYAYAVADAMLAERAK